jgi:alpha-mannosidase
VDDEPPTYKIHMPTLHALSLSAVISISVLWIAPVFGADTPASPARDTMWVIPHTHWEGAVFKTREEYLEMGLQNIQHALQLLKKYPDYTFVLDQVAYVKPFLERYPEQEGLFRQFVKEGRLELVLGMDVMPDVSKPGGETFIRQIQYGKGYYREELGVDVKIAWLLDTFGHHAQEPQLYKLGGYTSFWFFRGVPKQSFPSEFLWEGIDGSKIPAFWEPFGYGDFYGVPKKIEDFEKYAKRRFKALDVNSKGHDRVVYSGADVSDPQEQLPVMMREAQAGGRLPFNIRFGVPSRFEAVVLKRTDLPTFKGDMNPIFQGTYSSRIELKQWMRTDERLLTTAEKLGAVAQWLGKPFEHRRLWEGWEPVLFSETHDTASGVMTDHVYEDTVRSYEFAKKIADDLIDESWDRLADSVDTSGQGTPIVVFNTLSWPRSELVEVNLGFADSGVKGVAIADSNRKALAVQLISANRNPDGGLKEARIAFVARDIPPMGYAVFHATPRQEAIAAAEAQADADSLENENYRVTVDASTGAIKSIRVKDGDWEALSGPGNVVDRQDDHGDLWEPYHGLDGGSRIAMTAKQPLPKPGVDMFSTEFSGKPGTILKGPVFCEFSVAHPLDSGKFGTTVRLVAGSPRIDITTRLVNNSKFVRYQASFPTSIHDGRSTQSIPFGAIERAEGIEYPAQDWVDYGNSDRGVALLNVGLPGNLVSDGTMIVSLLRAHTLGAYGYGGGYEPGMGSESGFGIGQERTLHYAIAPHRGDWRDAKVWRDGMELNNPLICRTAAPHAGKLASLWSFVKVSNPNAVISSVTDGRDGAVLVRVYDATGRDTKDVMLAFPSEVASAKEVNFMEDHLADLSAQGKQIRFDLSAFQIKTLSVRLVSDGGR